MDFSAPTLAVYTIQRQVPTLRGGEDNGRVYLHDPDAVAVRYAMFVGRA